MNVQVHRMSRPTATPTLECVALELQGGAADQARPSGPLLGNASASHASGIMPVHH
jgi:hypothetical protein